MGILKGKEKRFHLQLSTNDLEIKAVFLKVLLDVCFISTAQDRAPSFGLSLYVRWGNLTFACALLSTGIHG